jgi:hypothetical protein
MTPCRTSERTTLHMFSTTATSRMKTSATDTFRNMLVVDRLNCIVVLILISATLLTPTFTVHAGEPVLRVECNADRPEVGVLSWDTEGGHRVHTNLLRANQPMALRVRLAGQWKRGSELFRKPAIVRGQEIHYELSPAANVDVHWNIAPSPGGLKMGFSVNGTAAKRVEALELIFPFDPGVTPTTVLPSQWADDGSLRLPAIISAPDFGQMLLADVAGRRLTARLEGSRSKKTVDFFVQIPTSGSSEACTLDLTPVRLSAPEQLQDKALWEQTRRGWFNVFQPSAKWGDQANPFSAPAGVLANNVISDPASCSLWFYADQALLTPQIAPNISVAALVRRTLDWWLDHRTRLTGEVICYWDYGNFLDANAGPLIAAWDYVEASGDTMWLRQRIERLEFISEFLAKRDVDNDGMVEAVQSGNRSTLKQPNRSCAWWDALNCGHKDGYTNALIYRAWRCLAELEERLGRRTQQTRWNNLADRLKAAYAKTLYNPATGWLAWWKSRDGELHDYATPIVNGIAIEYGLVDPVRGREILARLRNKMTAVGFKRFDLGVPPMLVPVLRADYLLPDAYGCPRNEDGADTVGQYMNGGITAGHVLHFLAAHYVADDPGPADKILKAMLKRQGRGDFQNGVRDASGQGIDWTTWDGKPSGYEGYLADNFRFLQAVLLREPAFRARYYRPFTQHSSK